MSRRESYKAPLHRSKFMVDFWLGIYQLKQIFVQIRGKDLEKDNILIPNFFTPHTNSRDRSQCIDDVDIYDVDISITNVQTLKDIIIPETYSRLLSAVQLQHSLRAAIKANLMTTRVTGYIKKKTFSSLLSKSKGAAQLTTDTKLIPDVTSLEYQVCHSVMHMLQVEFADVANQVTAKVERTLEHIKRILCVTLQEMNPTLTLEYLEETGLFLWSNPNFLTSWGAFVTALHQKEEEEGDAAAAAAAQNAKRKSVFKKIRKSVTNSITSSSSSSKTAISASEEAQNTLFAQVLSLAPLHSAYLQIMEQLSTPSSSCCFRNLTEANSSSGSSTATRARVESDASSDSTETVTPKWYFGKLVGRRPPSERRRAERNSSVGSMSSGDNEEGEGEGEGESRGGDADFTSNYSKIYGSVFITLEENSAVEIDHRLIHSVVNEPPPPLPPGCSSKDPSASVPIRSLTIGGLENNNDNNTDKVKNIRSLHEMLDASRDKDTDKRCLGEYASEGKELMDNVVSTTQIIRSMHNLFTEEDKGVDKLSYKHTIANLCLHVTHHWLKEAQRVQVAVQRLMAMRRKNVSAMIKEAMPICSEEEVEAVVTHDDGLHVHKLIAAVNNGHSEVARMLEARLRGPPSQVYSDMKLFSDQASQVLVSMTALLETPLKHLRC